MALSVGFAAAPLTPSTADEVDRQHNTQYSPLEQITRDNVRQLERAWTFHTGDVDNLTDSLSAFEDKPSLVEGNLIICTISRQLIALDPTSGEERWRYDPGGEVEAVKKCRGVSSWTDPEAPSDGVCRTRLFLGTNDYRLVAVDAKTGLPCEEFGDDGVVVMEPSIPTIMPAEVVAGSRPAVVNGVVVVGSMVADNQRVDAPSGRVLAFDARTGAPRWEFDPVPNDPADPAAATWENGSAERHGGGNVWASMSVDNDLDLVYLPTTSPSVDFYGGGRPGNNEYTSSIVALRGATGEVAWHFQFVHHNIWDYDTPSAPLLIDYPHNGEMVPALVQNLKTGLVFVFDRRTGEPLVPIEERPVPQDGAVPGEWLAPTQPFPVGMPAFAPLSFGVDDIWGFTPIDKGSCRDLMEQLRHGPIYTPPSLEGTIVQPSVSGGTNWGGAAYDPDTNIMVAPSSRVPVVVRLVPAEDAEVDSFSSIETSSAMIFPNTGAPYAVEIEPLLSSFGAPCIEPPWASLVGIDIVEKTIAWEVPIGRIDRMSPMPFPANMGTPGAGGPLATQGGVVFIGYSLDSFFRAFDLRTGDVLWKDSLPAPANSTPVTYEVDGEQYVVVTAGGHSMYGTKRSDAVIAYKLKQ